MSFILDFSIDKIIFSGGQTLNLSKKDKILIVGPNNSGKSQSIRDIVSILSEHDGNPVVITELKTNKNFNKADLEDYLKIYARFKDGSYHIGAAKVHNSHVLTFSGKEKIYSLSNLFIKQINAKDRLSICDTQKSIDLTEIKTVPQHVLYDNSKLMDKVSDIFKKAFNKDLAFDFRAGNKIPIHLVDKKELAHIPDRVSDEYIEKLRKFPQLDRQGDGIKSYAGILFETIAHNYAVTMIDEPEAFLHPPQMRRLGQTLSEEVSGQLLVATHSSDILRGFLEGTKGDLKVIRIRRDNNTNFIHELDHEVIKELWSKPNLRYSNALEAIFHEQVVICEDDSDCRFFNFIADYLTNEKKFIFPDTCYVPTGGKHAIAGVAKALRLSGVPVKAIFDFDLISEKNTLIKTLEAFGCSGHDLDSIMKLWDTINSEVTQKSKKITNAELKEMLTSLIINTPEDKISKNKIDDIFNQKKPWSDTKAHGINGLPKGNIRKTFQKFNGKLKELGIFLIPVGEVENFSAETGLHGPAFVEKFLSDRNVEEEDLKPLRDFVQEVYSSKITHQICETTESVT
ncbi:ATP-dependent nuclease [Serratia fonticola]|uniref:ATP-dependent nuclease n=1 Tax=Serratia fonticola TaxID=47917 RepID=UPI00192CFA1B|nr:AAA family ATPase [Serratia fonticola]MBL5828638.1 AAA family ATPase [Serratia fonticola]